MRNIGFYENIRIEGNMPERALLRLKRQGIDVFHVKKVEKNQILFTVRKKDSEKVFAIYPNVCYNRNTYSAYTARKMRAVGLERSRLFLKKRTGFLLGALLFLSVVFYAQSLVFAVDFIGSSVYKTETYKALEEAGVSLWKPYPQGKEDWICSKILSLKGVEYCSVKKTGMRVQVEIRLADFEKPTVKTGAMKSLYTGTLLSLTALSGTPLKEVGEEVKIGETLVQDQIFLPDGGQVCVDVIARAKIACDLDMKIEAETEEQAFATAYLSAGLETNGTIVEKSVLRDGNLFHVKMKYIIVQSVNL